MFCSEGCVNVTFLMFDSALLCTGQAAERLQPEGCDGEGAGEDGPAQVQQRGLRQERQLHRLRRPRRGQGRQHRHRQGRQGPRTPGEPQVPAGLF